MNKSLVHLLIVALMVFALPAQAGKMYKWVDKAGNVSYQDRPPPEDASRVEEKHMGEHPRYGGNKALPADVLEKFPVVLYAVPKCSGCDLARAYLRQRGVPFTEKNVQSDRAVQDEMKAKVGELSVPTITVGSKVMKGYLESILEGELEAAGYPKADKPEGEENAEDEDAAAQ